MTATIDDSGPLAHRKGGRPAPVLAPVPDGPGAERVWVMAAFLLGAVARETLGDQGTAGHPPRPRAAGSALTRGESRVLRYLPTNLSAREIAGELYLSVNTVKTHQRHLYQKLGARTRSQAVEQARALSLLTPASRSR
jgi:DNA-binding CsgD family transcriptional regulator